jgi:hypothetical protein
MNRTYIMHYTVVPQKSAPEKIEQDTSDFQHQNTSIAFFNDFEFLLTRARNPFL